MKLSSNVVSCTTGEIPIPEDIRPYLDIINGTGFYFKDYPSECDCRDYDSMIYYAYAHPFYNYSWFGYTNSDGQVEVISDDGDSKWLYETNILDIYVTSSNNTYTYNISFNRTIDFCKDTYWGYDRVYPGAMMWYNLERYRGCGSGMYNPTSLVSTATGTRVQVFSHIADRFRNVNIYLDGILISKANNIN